MTHDTKRRVLLASTWYSTYCTSSPSITLDLCGDIGPYIPCKQNQSLVKEYISIDELNYMISRSRMHTLAVAAIALSSLLAFSTEVDAFQVHTKPLTNGRAFDIHTEKNIHFLADRSMQPVTRATSSSTQLHSLWNNDELQGSDKIKACIPYVLPLLDGDFFGKYIYQRIPPLGAIDALFIAPLVSILTSFPFIPLLLFCLLSIGTRMNAENMSRNVRFNAQQAVLIDVSLILPTLIQDGLVDIDVPRVWAEFGCNFVWYFYMSAIVYSVTMNLRGQKPSGLPYLSNAAEVMTGPF